MRFYNRPHQYYCGIDLHVKTMYVCILNVGGQVYRGRQPCGLDKNGDLRVRQAGPRGRAAQRRVRRVMQFLLDVGSRSGMCVSRRCATRLFGADEAFLTSTTREAVPIVTVDDRRIGTGKPGPVTWKLLIAFRSQAEAS